MDQCWSFRNGQIHSSPTQPICLHSNQPKENLELQQLISLHHISQADQLQAWPMPSHQGQANPKLASGGG